MSDGVTDNTRSPRFAAGKAYHIPPSGGGCSCRPPVFIRFDTTAENIERLIERGHVDEPHEPAALRFFRFGPKSQFAREWNGTAEGRVYRVHRDNASVWLAINDQTETAYMAVFEHCTPWLERLRER